MSGRQTEEIRRIRVHSTDLLTVPVRVYIFEEWEQNIHVGIVRLHRIRSRCDQVNRLEFNLDSLHAEHFFNTHTLTNQD